MSHGNLVANALQNARWFGWTAAERTLGVLPICHTWGLCVCLNSTFAVKGTLILVRRFDPDETLALAARHRATVLYGSATMFFRLLDRPRAELPSLRHAKAGAMLTQGALKERWDERYPQAPLQQGYGLTEASPESHNNPPQRFKAGTVGVPIQDTHCRVVDAAGRDAKEGAAGEVLLRGPQVTSGYWRREESPLVDGWLRTGDVGVMDAEGYLTIVDRLKDMLKFRGYTVSPNAVEERLLRHPAVREAVVVGRPDERDGDVPVAFVVRGGAAAAEELIAHCRAALAPYEVPREVVFVEAIPRNAVGKPLRRVLRDACRSPGRDPWLGC
jgi:long-chain acyl-CoA synthetase